MFEVGIGVEAKGAPDSVSKHVWGQVSKPKLIEVLVIATEHDRSVNMFMWSLLCIYKWINDHLAILLNHPKTFIYSGASQNQTTPQIFQGMTWLI